MGVGVAPVGEGSSAKDRGTHSLYGHFKGAIQRKTLQAVAGDRWGDVSYLLGGWGRRRDTNSGKLLDGEKDNWKPDLIVVKATVQYLQETGRLTYQPEEG